MENSFDDMFHPRSTSSNTGGTAKDALHYQQGTKQPIEIMQDVMNRDELIGFLRGNILKYAMRYGHKETERPVKDVEKLKQYAEWLILVLNYQKIEPPRTT